MKRICLITLTLLLVIISPIRVHAGELHDAAKMGDIAKVRQLLEQGADVNAMDNISIPRCMRLLNRAMAI